MTERRRLIAGNWKMNGLLADSMALVQGVRSDLSADPVSAEVLVCPPFTMLDRVVTSLQETPLVVGGQDCHHDPAGAHTGDVSASMLADLGCRYVILGHSERRADHGETNSLIKAKMTASQDAGLTAIVCVGETREERDTGRAETVVQEQLLESLPTDCAAANTVIAYEPVWAIGTGLVPTLDDIDRMHQHIRQVLAARVDDASVIRILYGGSMKPANAETILAIPDVDGGLVGGASLKVADFLAIIRAA